MRNVFFAGAALAIVCLVANRAIALLNQPSDLAVADISCLWCWCRRWPVWRRGFGGVYEESLD